MIDAIKDMFKRYADFDGYSSRKQYIWGLLFSKLPVLIFLFLFTEYASSVGLFLGIIWLLITIMPMWALTARRTRSMGWPQWSWLLIFVPLINYFFIITLCATPNVDDTIFEDDTQTDENLLYSNLEKLSKNLESNIKTNKKNKNTNTKKKKKKSGNDYKINKFTLAMCLIGIFVVMIFGFVLFGNSYNFMGNMHGKNICKKIATEFNARSIELYLDTKSNTGVGLKGIGFNLAFDSEYKFVKRNERNEYSHDEGVCKIWIKGKNFEDRPYIIVDSSFYLVDKHGAKLNNTDKNIKEVKVMPEETVSLTFSFYNDSIKDAENVVFSYNNYYLPMNEEEYCIVQDRLAREAEKTYNYDYNEVLSCNCNPPSRFSYNNDSKCKIFNDDKVRENCVLLSIVVPSCNEYLKKIEKEEKEKAKKREEAKAKEKEREVAKAKAKESFADKYEDWWKNATPQIVEKAISDGAGVNEENGRLQTPLMMAAEWNENPQIIETLIKLGADVNAKGMDNMTALMFAAEKNKNPQIIETLIKLGADVNATNADYVTALYEAATSNQNPQIIETLIKHGSDVKVRWFRDDSTLLMGAARSNKNPQIIETLIKHGADVKERNYEGKTALMYAAEYSDNPQVIETLIKHGADVKERDDNGNTPLMYAAELYEKAQIIETLIEHGSDVKERNNNGETPLMFAAAGYRDNPQIIEILIKYGADAKEKDNNGKTPLMYAAGNWRGLTGNPQIIEALIKHGADVKERDNNGKTALMYAEAKNVEVLIKHGADAKEKDNNGKTPLMYAKSSYIIENLIKYGADVKEKDNDGKTPLMHAIINRVSKNIETLIKYGADVNIKDKDGKTALMYAAVEVTDHSFYKRERKHVIETLVKNGADVNAKDKNGKTALMYAAVELAEKNDGALADVWGNTTLQVVENLIKLGANVKAKDNSGKTALDYAEKNSEIYKLLKDLMRK